MKNTDVSHDGKGFLSRRPDVRVVSGAPQKQADCADGTEPACQAQDASVGAVSPNGKHNPVTRRPRGNGSVEVCKDGFRVRRVVDGKRVALGTYPTLEQAEDVLYGRAPARPEPTFENRFWANVAKGDGCWLWTAALNKAGYGRFASGTKNLFAHRVSWEMANGRPIPRGKYACHRCDTPACVRPDHLFIGTALDNTHDLLTKGRAPYQKRRAESGLPPTPIPPWTEPVQQEPTITAEVASHAGLSPMLLAEAYRDVMQRRAGR